METDTGDVGIYGIEQEGQARAGLLFRPHAEYSRQQEKRLVHFPLVLAITGGRKGIPHEIWPSRSLVLNILGSRRVTIGCSCYLTDRPGSRDLRRGTSVPGLSTIPARPPKMSPMPHAPASRFELLGRHAVSTPCASTHSEDRPVAERGAESLTPNSASR